MKKRLRQVLFVLILSSISVLLGCNIDGSSDVNSQVDELINNQRQETAALEQAAAANPAPASGSSSSSSTPAASTSSSSSSSSSSAGSAGGFVWKPVSESDGNLAVLLPPAYANKVKSLDVRKSGAVVVQGRFTGNTNGNRPTFRFSQPGAGYGSGLTVVATLSDGSTKTWSIPNGGQRVG